MSQIYHSNVVTTVSKAAPGQLLAQTLMLSGGYEAVARMTVAADSFIISEAGWEIHRSPGGRLNGGRAVPELAGQEAYFKIGPALKSVGLADGELPRELLADCVKGVIQAETYIFEGRGFANTEEYEAFWRDSYRNSCRRYSSAEGSEQSWFEFIEGRQWGGNCLFSRCKTATVHRLADGRLAANGSFIDSFHELNFAVVTDAGRITSCSAELVRVPHPVCRETEALVAALTGRAMHDITARAAAECAGGPAGCNHLVDIVYHTARTVRHSQEEAK